VDIDLSDEQLQLRDTLRRFLAERAPVSPYVRSMVGNQSAAVDALWRELASLGVTDLLVPGDGVGPDFTTVGVVLEELGRALFPGPFVSTAVGAVTAVVAAGSPDDRARLLPSLADGSRIGTVALYEPGRRYEWRTPSTVARRGKGGWMVTGAKAWVTDAPVCDELVVLAGAPEGLGLFVVDRRDVDVVKVRTVDGTRRYGNVVLVDAPAQRLGTSGEHPSVDVTAVVEQVLDALGIAYAADGLGAAQRALELSVEHAEHRHQFGVPIGSFQAVQHLCADMLRELELGRAGIAYALWACNAASPEERHRAATLVQAFVSDAFPRIGESAIQVFGGIGFTWEHDIHLFYKRLLGLQAAFGDAATHLDVLADLVID
jgi:alkylation response protein AidB-like acyl-CoA dehydrogenase